MRAAPHAEVQAVAGVESVEARLAELARARGPLRRVLVAIAGRLVERRGHQRLGYARLGDYARERLGLSGRALQEFAQVDAKLSELPRLERVLVAGELPWSKVRLLARFAGAEDVERWIRHARVRSCRALEKSLRAVDRGALEAGVVDEEGAEAGRTQTLRLRVPMGLAFEWKRTCDYAAKVEGGRVAPATVLEMVTAEVVSAFPVESVGSAGVEAPGRRDGAGDEAANVCAVHGCGEQGEGGGRELPVFLRPLVAGLEHTDAFELDARLRRIVRLEARLDAEIAPLLRHVTSARFEWSGQRVPSLAAYARERLGISPRKARALVRLERVGDRCTELRAAWRDGALSWAQAQLLARLVLAGEAENRALPAWVAWARRVSVRRLESVVQAAVLWRQACPEGWLALGGDPERVAAECEEPGEARSGERQTCARFTGAERRVSVRVTAPEGVARLFRASLCTVRRAIERETGRLPDEAEAFAAMLDHALQSWCVNDLWLRQQSRKRYRIFERDGWRCTVPGCTSQRNLHEHHITFRSAGGSDAPENLTTLCAFHHQRGVHGGTVRVSGEAPAGLWFELGTREGRAPLARYRSGDRVV